MNDSAKMKQLIANAVSKCCDGVWANFEEAADEVLADLEVMGFVIVPHKPTIPMLEALFGGMNCAGAELREKVLQARGRYETMLAKAPSCQPQS